MTKKTEKLLTTAKAVVYGVGFFACVCVDLYLATHLRSAIAAAGNPFEALAPVMSLLSMVAVTFYLLCSYVRCILFTRKLRYGY